VTVANSVSVAAVVVLVDIMVPVETADTFTVTGQPPSSLARRANRALKSTVPLVEEEASLKVADTSLGACVVNSELVALLLSSTLVASTFTYSKEVDVDVKVTHIVDPGIVIVEVTGGGEKVLFEMIVV
jgi:hypothetical protein